MPAAMMSISQKRPRVGRKVVIESFEVDTAIDQLEAFAVEGDDAPALPMAAVLRELVDHRALPTLAGVRWQPRGVAERCQAGCAWHTRHVEFTSAITRPLVSSREEVVAPE